MSEEYLVDPNRKTCFGTGIYVRAKDGERWGSFDIDALDKKSLLAWLRSRGGNNAWAEDVVGILLGHGSFTIADEEQDERRQGT